MQDRRLRTDVLFIRVQSMIRADGFSSAQHCDPAIAGRKFYDHLQQPAPALR
jgi:hypothetical protein